mgnify:CR=1 FL=1
MATQTAAYSAPPTDTHGAVQTAINACNAGDTALIDVAAGNWEFGCTTGAGNPAYSVALKSGSAGSPIAHTINGTIVADAAQFTGVQDALIGCDKKSYVTVNGSGLVNGAAMPQTEEHRHCMGMRGSDNITIYGSSGLRFNNSGGDGIEIGPTALDLDGLRTPCTNIVIEDLSCSGNRRNGISVTSANGLRIRRCTTIRQIGTSPYSGIDLEPDENTAGYTAPNQHKSVLIDCRIEDCIAYGNLGGDFYVQLSEMSSSHADVDVVFSGCKSLYDSTGGDPWGYVFANTPSVTVGNFDGSSVGGTVSFVNCMASKLLYPGIYVAMELDSNVAVDFTGCILEGTAVSFDKPIHLVLTKSASGPGIRFKNVVVKENVDRAPYAVTSPDATATNVTGNIRQVVRRWPVKTQRDSLLPNLKIGRFGRLQFSNSARSRRSAQRGEK